MKNLLLVLLTLTIVLILSSLTMAQPGLPGFPDAPSQAPIDGGLGLLAAAGGAYAYKMLKGRRAQDNDLDV